MHTVSKELIMYIGLVGLFFSSTGLHDVLYKNSGKVYVLIGVGIFFLVEYLKRYIEYRADRYALKCGVDIRILESAVRCIEEMNSGNKIIISDHPKTERRFRINGIFALFFCFCIDFSVRVCYNDCVYDLSRPMRRNGDFYEDLFTLGKR